MKDYQFHISSPYRVCPLGAHEDYQHGNLAHYMVAHTVIHAWKMSAGRFDIGSLNTYNEAVKRFG